MVVVGPTLWRSPAAPKTLSQIARKFQRRRRMQRRLAVHCADYRSLARDGAIVNDLSVFRETNAVADPNERIVFSIATQFGRKHCEA
jgi:hypothetical protein